MNEHISWILLLIVSGGLGGAVFTYILGSRMARRRLLLEKLETLYELTCMLYHNVILRLDNAENRDSANTRQGSAYKVSSSLEIRESLDKIQMICGFYHKDLLRHFQAFPGLFDEHNEFVKALRNQTGIEGSYQVVLHRPAFDTRWQEACDTAKVRIHAKANGYIHSVWHRWYRKVRMICRRKNRKRK